ncbi:hypothetical protein IMZ29_12760 [Achromobacter sp. GG226]|uniref:hypothetical protein n=1 Tax=Verticiella alkaliphila TaxID=2779529 RepID=UPI001C0E732E|nr:hypothetical protein [Verticiella sp. GG226]MBU4611367.1 hypothetical protein [Verticiella sp. GG226]
MAVWIPAAKLILPHVASIVSAAIPAFTRRRPADGEVNPAELQQQITELQAASTQNAERIRELAEQLQETLQALNTSALAAQQQIRRAHSLAMIGFGTALAALCFALFAFFSS